MYIPDIYQNDREEKLNQKNFTLTMTRQERNFNCILKKRQGSANKDDIENIVLETKLISIRESNHLFYAL